jgi:hypothetical protein
MFHLHAASLVVATFSKVVPVPAATDPKPALGAVMRSSCHATNTIAMRNWDNRFCFSIKVRS